MLPWWGFGGAARRRYNRKEFSMTKSAKKRLPKSAANRARTSKPSKPAAAETSKSLSAVSKQARVVAMLKSSMGATIDAIMKETDWQQHSVRGFLAGVVRKKLKHKLVSKKVDGERIYRINGGSRAKADHELLEHRPA
jgi:hypothetical protein